MMELDVFPAELRRRAIEVGQVLKMELFLEDRIRPKNGKNSKLKRFVIIGKTEDGNVLAALLVNTRINDNLFTVIAPYQHLVKAADNDYLDHDSYIDCYTIREFNAPRVLEKAEFLGTVKSDDLEECLEHVRKSPAIKPYILKKFHLGEK